MGTTAERVLVVDDEALIVYVLSRSLEDEGYLVKGMGSAEEALNHLEGDRCDLCFLDLMLPGLDGVSALRSIKARWPATKVVLMTAGIPTRRDELTIAALADGFLSKPFQLTHVRTLARRVLGASGTC